VSLINSLWPLIVTLGVLVFVHELGHFLAAKWAGIRVHRFAVGMGNPIPGLAFRWGPTEYALCWLPLGGYVKMASKEEAATSSALEGHDPDGRPEGAPPILPEEYFEAKPIWKRVIVILAGVTMNVLFAWSLYTAIRWHYGEQFNPETRVGRVISEGLSPEVQPLTEIRPGDRIVAVDGRSVAAWEDVTTGILNSPADTVRIRLEDGRTVELPIHRTALKERQEATEALQVEVPATVAGVVRGSPAAQAGLEAGDTVIRADGDSLRDWFDLYDRIRARPGQPMHLVLGTAHGRREVTITPMTETERNPDGSSIQVGKLGIARSQRVEHRRLSWPAAIRVGWHETVAASTTIVRTVQGLLSRRISSQTLGGPILIGQVAAATAHAGMEVFLEFMALVSVNLAVLNLLPIPILDGGQLLFLIAEGVRRRPLPLRLRERLTLVGLVLIVLLMVVAFRNDIVRNWDWIVSVLRRAVGALRGLLGG
jgi:regulator of sigma E protease